MNANDEVNVVVYDKFGVADTVSASSGGTFSGSVDFSSNIDVDGTSNLDVVDIDGAVDMASTLQVDGAITSSSGATITTSGQEFHSCDVDFRVEGNGDENLFFVDAGNDRVGIGTNSPVALTDSASPSLTIKSNGPYIFLQDANNANESIYLSNNGGRFRAGGANDDGGTQIEAFAFSTTEVVINEDSNDIDFRVESNADANAFLVDGGTGNVTLSNVSTNTNPEADMGVVHLIRNTSSTNDTGAAISLGSNSNYGTGIYGQLIDNSTNEHRMGFQVRNSSGSSGTRMNITGAGKIQIGNTNTTARVNIGFTHSAGEEGIRLTPNATTATNEDGVVVAKDVPQKAHTDGKKDTTDAYGNEVDALYTSDSTWTKTKTEDVYQSIDQSKLVPLLVKTIQELEARVAELESS